MPGTPTPQKFAKQLSNAGHRAGIIWPISIALICVAGQLLFTDYFKNVSPLDIYVCLGGGIGLILSELLVRHPPKSWKIIQSLLLHALALFAFGYVLPIPSPYLVFIGLLGLLTYFDFGIKAMSLSLGGSFVFLTSRYLVIHGLQDPTGFSLFLVTYITAAVMTFYATIFLRLSEQELRFAEKSSNRALANQQQVESLINNISDGVIAVDADLKVMIYNAAALDVLDLNTEIKNRNLATFLKPINVEKQTIDIAELLHKTTVPTINRDLSIQYNDGSTANLFLGIAPIYLGYGKSVNNGYTLLLRDITREKSLEEERDEFISVVSHELRTPITIAEGNVSNAQMAVTNNGDMAEVKKALEEAHHQVLFLADMINDLATLSRAERGVLEVEVEPINVVELCQELADNYLPQARSKGLEIKTELDPNLELLHSSKLYVREILQNFITNSLKYTEKGRITIGAKPAAKGIHFYVSDTGIGISRGDQERVWDKFFRSEDFRTRASNGTGLGLYVTMKLAHLIHAELSLESELNKGSTFTIIIPNLEAET